MNVWTFLKDKCLLLILHFVCMCLLAGFLLATGYGRENVVLILQFYSFLLVFWLAVSYLQRRSYFREVEKILEQMDQRYLLGELLPDSFRLEDRLYREIIRRSNKSVIERIRRIEDERLAYEEYIESWVHEVKAPITSISLLCENNRKPAPQNPHTSVREICRTISMENQKIENFVDMALYYARSEDVYKDYFIKETSLQEIACDVLEKNRLLLIQNQAGAEADCKDTVYTDPKWIAFILNQLVLNSVKYKSGQLFLRIFTKRTENGVLLTLEDNGTGIRAEELPRIFEKGFTGSNGRCRRRSTGMGLYLCRKLCDKLGIGISARSVYGEKTWITLEFPISSYVTRQPNIPHQACYAAEPMPFR